MQATINGISIAYHDQGKGPPIVFLHAFPLNRTMWAQQEAALSSNFRVITIDLRGHGESDAQHDTTLITVTSLSNPSLQVVVKDFTIIPRARLFLPVILR